MKICLQNKTPILTEEVIPSWKCSNTCCFKRFYLKHGVSLCNHIPLKCIKGNFYKLQNTISDIFTL